MHLTAGLPGRVLRDAYPGTSLDPIRSLTYDAIYCICTVIQHGGPSLDDRNRSRTGELRQPSIPLSPLAPFAGRAVATLTMDVNEEAGIRPGYRLKLNSYDLGVDIELHDALQRIRFEHPEVATVVLTSGKDRIFCSGANIFMLGLSSHAWKVNFCKFTNETRNGIEDSSAHSGLKFLAACNGTTAGGGYELALACDEIVLVDDRSSAVSLPEVPLLGVLPGTGGLTRLTDKRRVRRDHADIFCTTVEGVRGQRARDWRLVDALVKPQAFPEAVEQRALALAASSDRPADARGVALPPLGREDRRARDSAIQVQVDLDPARRVVEAHRAGARRCRPRTRRRGVRGRRGLVAAARWRGNWTMPS